MSDDRVENGDLDLVDVLIKMMELHKRSANFRIDIHDLCEEEKVTNYYYNKWLNQLHNIAKGRIDVEPEIVSAAHQVLAIVPFRRGKGRLMRFAPLTKMENDNCLGVCKGTLTDYGQLVRISVIKPGGDNVEIVDDFTNEYCGVIHKRNLIDLDEDIQERIKLVKAGMNSLRPDDIEEIVEKARIIKINNEQIRAKREAETRMEKELAKKRKVEREKAQQRTVPIGDLSKLNELIS